MPRPATLTDVTAMAAIHAAAFSPKEIWSRDVFALQLALPNVFGLVDEAGGLILVRNAADEAEVLTLAVSPRARQRGVGGRLLREAIAVAAKAGARTMFLEVSVANIAARTLYTRAGFVRAGLRRRYYSDGSDALVLRLDVEEVV